MLETPVCIMRFTKQSSCVAMLSLYPILSKAVVLKLDLSSKGLVFKTSATYNDVSCIA